MSTTCHRCGTTWGGHRTEHCTACCETFTGTTSGDKHRVGDHAVHVGPARRRCLTPDEMRAKGMTQNARGQWTSGGTPYWGSADTETPILDIRGRSVAANGADPVRGATDDAARALVEEEGLHAESLEVWDI